MADVKLKALLGWSIGSFTSATLIGAVGLLHLRFLTDSLGISIGLAGSFVVLSRIYDAAFDPVMGVISDYTRTPFGRYRPYLLLGGLMAAASLVVMFNVPYALHGAWLSVYVVGSLFFFSTAYTMFRIPYLAIGRSITQDFTERSRLMSFSVYGSSLGGLAATAAAPFLLAKLGSDRAGHGVVAILLACFIATGAIVSFILIKADGEEPALAVGAVRHKLTFRESMAALKANRPFQCLIAFKMLMFAGLSVHISSIPYYTRYVLKRSDTA
ncbi:MAG: MFS transporter, partial [Caulobacteraceae bacterium]